MGKRSRRVNPSADTDAPTEDSANGVLFPDKKSEFLRGIKNKDVRKKLFAKVKRSRKERKNDRPPRDNESRKSRKKKAEADDLEEGVKCDTRPKRGVPHTIESLRIPDETTINITDEKKLELEKDLDHDEFSSYFKQEVEPKVLITYSDRPKKQAYAFGQTLTRIIPNSHATVRPGMATKTKDLVKWAIRDGVTDIVMINQDMKKPNGLLLIHLPDGPTAHFRLSNVKVPTDMKRNPDSITHHRPEVILNNFTTRLGITVSRMLASLFHYDPEFVGRRAVTFHNQRDYIFFRHHRYEFKNKKKVALREMGPRFTLKLRSLQRGTFDSKTGDYEWIEEGRRHEIETSRRKFFL